MSLAQLKQEAASLSATEQGELMSYLAAIQLSADDELRAELTQKIDDHTPGWWWIWKT